jgi:hypothetical protein
MNWRPIKTAPKDEQVLLCYPSFSSEGGFIVNQGRWVEYPHTNQIVHALSNNENPSAIKCEGHWEIGYVAIMDHGGRWNGKSFEERGCRVEPTHWQPLPAPKKKK